MANIDNDVVTSVLLLILISIAIMFLFNMDTFKSEKFDSLSNTSTQQNSSNNTIPSNNIVPSIPSNSIISSNSIVPSIPTNSIVPSSITSDNTELSNDNTMASNQHHHKHHHNKPSVSFSDLLPPIETKDPSLFDFTPYDESSDLVDGTNLNDAFTAPIPQGQNADVVDFKKGNIDNYDAKDFLPKEINDEWFETDFSLAKYQLNDDKLINTERYIIGINTVGQSLKNASYDIRGTIPNPKFTVSPWNNSTYEPDFNLKPLC